MELLEARFAVLALSGAMLIWQIYVRPYPHFLDNLTIFLNIVSGITFQVLLFLKERKILGDGQQVETLICEIMTGLIGLCEILSILRLVKSFRERGKEKEKKIKRKQQKKRSS
jgi:uncharacterized membrane protein YuzA (DUF378 family)